MITDRSGKPLASSADEGAEAIVYATPPPAGLTGPPIEQFRIVAKDDGWEIRTNASGVGKVYRRDLPDLIASIIRMMLSDQGKMLTRRFDQMRSEAPIPEREPAA